MSPTEIFTSIFADVGDEKELLIWPGEGSFEVVVGAILVQNTAWKNVEKALANLKSRNLIGIDEILSISINELAELIKPSGFYNTKAKRLNGLCRAIKSEFNDFENFKSNVSREWLLSVKGVGAETCDAILAYACDRAVMVVDNYAIRILTALGYEFECYDEAQEWLSGVDFDRIYKILPNASEAEIFRIFHALVLEFCKRYSKGKSISEQGLKILGVN
ncbi:3-methyladenine DNA glycosylase [Campylobacter mucosalis]|uniref:3-methyladenine DNA glycosylase n=1 Tax=Campylobacter mucosalis TaxID=202 RepID=UPI001470656A|nr:3-methyladenine DNA glycosylase [Campylobacter mucosalis]